VRRAQKLILVFFIGCGGGQTTAPQPSQPNQPAQQPPAAHWTYDDVAHWEGSCGTGTHQSPIDLPASSPEKPLTMTATYTPFPISILNNGHTIQIEDAAPSSLKIDGVEYALAQFHFHFPSEHTLAGKSYDAEIHFVHKSADGKALVIGVFVQKGKPNADLAPVFDAVGKATKAAQKLPATFDPTTIIPKSPRYAHYDGSLTTPPCSEGVSWFVETASVIEISEQQLAALRAPFHGDTHRPTQPLNGRTVVTQKPL
jgi:carbonic anhydrase